MKPQATTEERYKTLAEADAAIRRYEYDIYITVVESRVEYQPDTIMSLFKYDYKPYKVVIVWTLVA